MRLAAFMLVGLAARIVEQVETSASEALKRSELRGRVEVNERGPR